MQQNAAAAAAHRKRK